LAHRLNPDNLVAREVNLAYNRSLRAGKPQRLDLNTAVERVFGTKFRQWDEILRLNGPIDEPAFCVALGQIFLDQGLPRQAALQSLRALQFEPANVDASLQLASTYQSVGLHDRTLATVDAVRKQTGTRPLTAVEQIEFARLEALAYAGRGEIPLAERVIRSAQQNHPGASALVLTLVEIYSSSGQHDKVVAALDAALQSNPDQPKLLETKALACLKLQRYADANQALAQILARDPENPQALVIQGALFIQTQQYTNALGPLNRALQQQPNNMPALINRAIALLQSGQLEAAEKDYLALLKYLPHLHRVHYGLGEIAFRRQNSAKAIEHYQEYLALAPTDTEEAREVQQRLQQLKSAPKK
jgi:tetratricopeptide (TPR) repeat protein